MDTRLLALFKALGLEPTAEELAELFWLAGHLDEAAAPGPPEPQPGTPAAPVEPAATASQTPRAATQPSTEPAQPRPGPGTSATTTEPETTKLYPAHAAGATARGETVHVRPFSTPGGHALPGALEIGRALRPLKRRIPSRTRRLLDEVATAEHIADTSDPATGTADWAPTLKPAPERWLSVVLVVDEAPGMVVWQRTLVEFTTLLERLGAFRTVEVWGTRPGPGGTAHLYVGAGSGADRSRQRRPGELLDHLGRRLILVVSDCVSAPWHNGAMQAMLALWGQRNLVAIIQTLPDRLWPRTGLHGQPLVYLRTREAGTPNRRLEKRWLFRAPRRATGGLPVPVLTLDANMLGLWARALAGNSALWVPGCVLLPPRTSATGGEGAVPAPATVSAETLADAFMGSASPAARTLAGYLAAVPLTLPIMRLVQAVTLPESRQVHLAEVLLSGMIRRASPLDDRLPADEVAYDFVPGVRDLLLNTVRVGITLDVMAAVSDFIAERAGQALDFQALLADTEATGTLTIEGPHREFARIAARPLRRFGGDYARLADRLETTLGIRTIASPAVPEAGTAGARGEGAAAPATGRPAQAFAMLVGINRLDPASRRMEGGGAFPELHGCVNDVRLLQPVLDARFRRSSVPLTLRTLIVDTSQVEGHTEAAGDPGAELPTLANILAFWDEVEREAQAGDVVLFQFSGHGQRVPGEDPDEADGQDEMMIVYDTFVPSPPQYFSHRELAARAARLDSRGVHLILLLDTVEAGSGIYARTPWRNSVILAACRENEQSYEYPFDGSAQNGALVYWLAAALRQLEPGVTWAELYRVIFAEIKAQFEKQTPQIYGAVDQPVDPGSTPRAVPPRLPGKPGAPATGGGAEPLAGVVFAHRALGLQPGGVLEVQRGTDEPLRAAVTRVADEYVAVAFEEAAQSRLAEQASQSPPGLEVRILTFSPRPELLVRWEGIASPPDEASARVRTAADDQSADVIVRAGPAGFQVEDADGRRILGGPPAETGTILPLLEQLASYRHFLAIANAEPAAELRDAVTLQVETQATAAGLTAGTPAMLVVTNRAPKECFVSLWAATARLGVQRLYPAQTDCVLLAAGRSLYVPIVPQLGAGNVDGERIVYKAIASIAPHDLGVMALDEVAPEIEVYSRDALTADSPSAPAQGMVGQAGAATNARGRLTRLDAQQSKQLQSAILDAFTAASLERMVRFELDVDLQMITGAGPLQTVVFELISWAQRTGNLDRLLDGALAQNPGNVSLQDVDQALRGRPTGAGGTR